MRLFLILTIFVLTISANGQMKPISIDKLKNPACIPIKNKKQKTKSYSAPYVVRNKIVNTDRQPLYYINRNICNPSIIKTIDPHLIESIQVEKQEIEYDGKKYYGTIHFTMKKEYKPELISLNDLKTKYSIEPDILTIFMIDNDFIKDDYNNYIVDENYILQIIFDKIETKDENRNIDIIRLITKTEENIKKSKEIRIRGVGIL